MKKNVCKFLRNFLQKILGLKIFVQIFLQIFVQIFGGKIFAQIFAEKFAKQLAQIFYDLKFKEVECLFLFLCPDASVLSFDSNRTRSAHRITF